MFTKSARFYDALYHWKDYAGEAARIHAIIEETKRAPDATLLDVGCGTGMHLVHLQQHYAVQGLDLDGALLAVARKRLPDVPFHQADMTCFELGRRYGAIVCLFSAISYVQTVPRLFDAIACMARHLAPGGVLLVEPWFEPGVLNTEGVYSHFVDEPDLKVARVSRTTVADGISTLHFHYLVGTPEGVEYFTEDHALGLFTQAQHIAAFENAGLSVSYDPDGLMGRGLYTATRPL